MEFSTYQKDAARTSGANDVEFAGRVDWKNQPFPSVFADWQQLRDQARAEKRLATAAMGLSGEAGELTDYFKKVLGHGHQLDVEVVKKECGDVLWYCAEVCSSLGLRLDEVAEMNIEKLRKRYGDKFSSEKSINRTE